MAISFEVNGKRESVDVDPQTPLLWVLRDNLNLTGTKYGCGIAACGACTVHIDGEAARSCAYSLSHRWRARKLPPSKDCRTTAAIPCSRRGFRNRYRNADTANPDRS